MHHFIDILAIIVLSFFFVNGWRRGFLVSALGVIRIIISLSLALFIGEWLGSLMADKLYKPRLATWFACGLVTFSLVAFAFRILIVELHDRNQRRKEKEGVKLGILSRMSGGLISLTASAFTLTLLYWLIELLLVALMNTSIPGGGESKTGPFARRTVYEITYKLAARDGKEEQAAATARMVSDPAAGFFATEEVLKAPSVQQLFGNPEFAQEFLSGDAVTIKNSTSMQNFFHDEETLNHLRNLGVLSKKDTQTGVSEKLAAMGRKLQEKLSDEKIQACIDKLKEREMLSPEKIPELVRDPYFHYILDTVLKKAPEEGRQGALPSPIED
jgi:uncharacterized membrane protein required for colicin V production